MNKKSTFLSEEEIYKKITKIQTRREFIEVLEDVYCNISFLNIENNFTEYYLSAVAGLVEDNKISDKMSYSQLAQLLFNALYYE